MWGPTAEKAEDHCFTENADVGDIWASCGKNSSGLYVKCATEDILCGKLQCKAVEGESLPKYPVIGSYRGNHNVYSNSGPIFY